MSTADRLPLSRERIISSAIQLVDQQGLGALSMRKLGAELGVEAMSLYNHIENKDDVLDGMCDVIMGEMRTPPREGPWSQRLRALVLEMRRVLLSHPGVLPLFGTRPPVTPEGFAPVVALHEIMVDAALPADRDVHAFVFVASMVLGYLRLDEGRMQQTGGEPYNRWSVVENGPAVRLGNLLVERDWDLEFEGCIDLVIESLVALGGRVDPVGE